MQKQYYIISYCIWLASSGILSTTRSQQSPQWPIPSHLECLSIWDWHTVHECHHPHNPSIHIT